MEYRSFGTHDDKLSVLGFGAIVLIGEDATESANIISESIDAGINYYDVAPSYGEAQGMLGRAEILLGPALQRYRKDCFLACKTTERSSERGSFEFYRSLERLKTDHLDLYQLHAITDVKEDVEAAFAKDGIMEFLIKRKAAGAIKYLGFSAHSEAAALAAMRLYDFDSVLFPLNYGNYMHNGFGKGILEEATKRHMARLALKSMARQLWEPGDTRADHSKCWYEPLEDPDQIRKALTWTLSQGVTAALPPGEIKQFRIAVDLVNEGLPPLSDEELLSLKQDAETINPLFKN